MGVRGAVDEVDAKQFSLAQRSVGARNAAVVGPTREGDAYDKTLMIRARITFRVGPTTAAFRADAALPRGELLRINSSTAPRTPIRCTSTVSTRRDGRQPRGNGESLLCPGSIRLRVRCHAIRLPPLSLPRDALGHAHRQGPLRAPSSSTRAGSSEADELLMVMNGFNTNFDGQGNQVYAVNTVGSPMSRRRSRSNAASWCGSTWPTCSSSTRSTPFHIHGNFFHYYPTGTITASPLSTPTPSPGPGARGIIELRFPLSGPVPLPRPQDRVRRVGWLGLFEVEE